MKPNTYFKELYCFDKRKEDSKQIQSQFPCRIPVICERYKYSTNTPLIDKKKYLVPLNITMGEFIGLIRKRMKIRSDMALFCFTGGFMTSNAQFMANLYSEYRDEDGFLYIYYATENTFG